MSNKYSLTTPTKAGYTVSQRRDWVELTQTIVSTLDTTYLTNISSLVGANISAVTSPEVSRLVMLDPGTNLIFRLKYNASLTGVTNPIIKVYGVDRNGKFHFLKNLSGSQTMTVTVATSTDITDGTWKYTNVVADNIVDTQGSTYFMVVVSTALDGTGTKTTARLEYKIL